MDNIDFSPLEDSSKLLHDFDRMFEVIQGALRGALTFVQAVQSGQRMSAQQGVEVIAALTQLLASLASTRKIAADQADKYYQLIRKP